MRPLFVRGRNDHGEDEMTRIHERERELYDEISATLAQRLPDVDVLAVELLGADRFCVFVDHPAGVDHALCERVTAVLRSYLDRYTVDVSSPGLDRPVRTREHFVRARGRRVALRTEHEIGGRRRFRGEVAEAGPQAVALVGSAGRIEIPYVEIVRGNVIDGGGSHE
jgi:ribosome maturation factor RimP